MPELEPIKEALREVITAFRSIETHATMENVGRHKVILPLSQCATHLDNARTCLERALREIKKVPI